MSTFLRFFPARKRPSRAFTLIELLTVIAVIGVLVAILFPVATRVRALGGSTRCLSDLRQIGAALLLYANEIRGRLPSTSHDRAPDGTSRSWTHTLASYLGANFLGRCPSAPDHPAKITYGWNDLLVTAAGEGIAFTACRTPAATLAAAELSLDELSEHLHFSGAARGRVTSALFRSQVNVECHGSGANYLFVDAHVQRVSWADAQVRLTGSNSPFVQP